MYLHSLFTCIIFYLPLFYHMSSKLKLGCGLSPIIKVIFDLVWCGYASGARRRLFAHGPADATAIQKHHHLLPHLNPDWFHLSGIGLPTLSRKRGR